MSGDIKIFEINDRTEIDSTEADRNVEISDLKEGDRVIIDVDDHNVIRRIEIEPSEDLI
jgi:hypothetical protein